jgi:hypothetical protein
MNAHYGHLLHEVASIIAHQSPTHSVLLFYFRTNISRKRVFIALFISVVILIAILTAYQFGIRNEDEPKKIGPFGAVAANGPECADLGAAILKKQGSVADAAITTMLCEGITCEFTHHQPLPMLLLIV